MDTKYRLLLTQVNCFIATIKYLYTDVKLQKNEGILASTSQVLALFERAVESGLASQEEVLSAESSFKTIQSDMKKEWPKQYLDLAGSTISTLEAIKGIDPESVTSCLQKIQPAETWNVDIKKYQIMSAGLSEADQLITSLGLDTEIIAFLRNTNAGKATLKDLDDKVLAWIRNEQLENKIQISFVKRKKEF